MKLSEKRKQAIYSAVHERIMQLRILLDREGGLQGTNLGEWVDYQVAQAMNDSASAAVKAARGKS